MDAVDQLLLADHPDSSQHRSSHFAELILDQIQPGAVLWREHKGEALRYGVEIAPRLFGDMRGMVVQHQTDLLVRRISAVQGLQECDEVGAVVRIADGFNDPPAVQIQTG